MGLGSLAAELERQRAHLPLWLPVFFGIGIALYFSLSVEPETWMAAALAGAVVMLLAIAIAAPSVRPVLILTGMVAAGTVAAFLRATIVAAPVLPAELSAAVEGRIVGLSRSASNSTRVLLDRVVIHGVEPDATPHYVRISIDETTPPEALLPGQRILGMARLSPPGGPVEPGGFDFRAAAWFDRLGAIGYTRTPMIEAEGVDNSGLWQTAFRLRMDLSGYIRERVPGQNGAFAAAILTGDRSKIDRAVEDDLRVSTLYHLVSISGLHMSMLAAAVFGILRYGLALVPYLALNWPLKKIAAAAALIAGAGYLFISGSEVPTQRAYIMTSTFLLAVLLDRPAITLRSVALAALIVLILAPESLIQAGIQMSFAATVALVGAFDGLRSRPWWTVTQTDRRWRLAKPVLGVAITSLVAGLATAPISAFHFNLLSQYGLLANLLAVPAMGAVVMPAAVVAALAAPIGLDWPAFTVMGWGIGYILDVAALVAGLGGAARGVAAGPDVSLGLLAFGGLFVVLFIGRGRWVGLLPIVLGAALWWSAERPDLLISDDGGLFGLRTEAGRALSRARGDGYAAQSWLADDGDVATQEEAAARGTFDRSRGRASAELPGLGLVLYVGTSDPATASADCSTAAILVAPQWTVRPSGSCLFIGANELARDGALGIYLEKDGFRIESALVEAAGRPWSRPPVAETAWRYAMTRKATPPKTVGLNAGSR